MNIKKHTLNNGLRLIVVPEKSIESATLTVWTRVGSRFEEKKVNGISHFLEHIVFKGSKKRPSTKLISEVVDGMGAEFNAATSKEWTNFYIKTRAATIETAFDVLSDVILSPLIDKEEVEREKGVIVEEIAMYEDLPMIKVAEYFENLIFGGDPLGWDTIGTVKSVKGVTRDDFVRYRKKHYYAENMLLTVAGGVNEKEIVNLANKYFSGFKKKGSKAKKPKAVFTQKKPQVLVKHKETDQTHTIIGFRGDPKGSKDEYAESVLASILGGGMSSRLFLEVRERRGLAYAVKTSADHYMDNGYFGTYAGLDTKRIDNAIEVILDQYYGIASEKYPIDGKELTKAKEYLKGRLALALEDTKNVNGFIGIEELLLEKTDTPDEIYKAIDKVKVDDVIAVAKRMFTPRGLNLSVVGPFKDDKKFKNLIS